MLIKYSSKQIEKSTVRSTFLSDATKIYFYTGSTWLTIVTDKIPYVAPSSEFTRTGFVSVEAGNWYQGNLPLAPGAPKGYTAIVAGTSAAIGVLQRSGGKYQKAWFFHAPAPGPWLEEALADLGKPGSDKEVEAVIMMTEDNASDLLLQYQNLLEKALGRPCDKLILWEAYWLDFAMVFREVNSDVPIGSFGHLYLVEEWYIEEHGSSLQNEIYIDPNKTQYFYGMNRQEFKITEFHNGDPIHDAMIKRDPSFSSFYFRIYRTQKEEYIDAAKLYSTYDNNRLKRGNLGHIVKSETPQVIHAEGLPFFVNRTTIDQEMGKDVLLSLKPKNVDIFAQQFKPGKGYQEKVTLTLTSISPSPICIYIFLKEQDRYTFVYRVWTWEVAALEAVAPADFIQPVPEGRKEVLVIARPEREDDAMRALRCLEEKMPHLAVDSHTMCWFTRTAYNIVWVSSGNSVIFGCNNNLLSE